MATLVRNTGTRIRYDGDDGKWHAKVRVINQGTDGERFLEFVGQFVTLLELISWFVAIFNGAAATPDTNVLGHSGSIAVTSTPDDGP
jgi:hypothetical protein